MQKFITSFLALSLCCTVFFGLAQQTISTEKVNQLVIKNGEKITLPNKKHAGYRVSDAYTDKTSGAVIAYLQHTWKGVDIYNALTTVAFKNEQAISVQQSAFADPEAAAGKASAAPVIAPVKAVQQAAAEIGLSLPQAVVALSQAPDGQELVFGKLGISFSDIIARLMWAQPTAEDNRLLLTWQVAIHTVSSNDYWLIKVDANTGKVIRKENLTARCSWEPVNGLHKMSCFEYRDNTAGITGVTGATAINSGKYKVIPYPNEDANRGVPTLVTDPWNMFPNTNATTLKWNNDGTKDYDSTRGNNVIAIGDLDGKNTTSDKGARSQTPLPDLSFDYTPDVFGEPDEGNNLSFGVTNLFYWNNIIHDLYYQYGFDEVSGNFQVSNLSRGGKGNDYVNADGADGSGSNNANFATPADGSAPRMQMFLWSPSPLRSMYINAPSNISGFMPAQEGDVSDNNKIAAKGADIITDIVPYRDINNPETFFACFQAANKADLVGKIAYIRRRGCIDDAVNSFTSKIKNAQTAGAIAVIIGNNSTHPDSSGLLTMTGNDNTITIPAFFITTADADLLEGRLRNGEKVNVTLYYRNPQVDGSLDNGVVVHEYTHGLSNRLTGGPGTTSCLSNGEQMGEGWSDYFALMMTTDWANAKVSDGAIPRPIGNYATGVTPEYGGIRTYPYSTDFALNPWTYDSLKLSSRIREYSFFANPGAIYFTGEVWCNTLWEMTWELVKGLGINTTFWDASKPGGNTIAMQLVTTGMKLQKCNPGCIDGRDGILKADTLLYGGAYSYYIWRAFARRGMGYSALQGLNSKIKDGTAAYDLPPAVLPSVWAYFSAEKIKTTALLKWATTAETNTERFVVERTTDGLNYSAIGYVTAAGNSTGIKEYMLTDVSPVKGTNVYRVKSVDKDGAVTYSEARSLVFEESGNIYSIAPNPARSKAVLTVKGNRNSLQVIVVNGIGQQVGRYILSGESMPIDVSRLSPGVYYINITGNGISHKEKLVVQ